jgi:hypothetical protein
MASVHQKHPWPRVMVSMFFGLSVCAAGLVAGFGSFFGFWPLHDVATAETSVKRTMAFLSMTGGFKGLVSSEAFRACHEDANSLQITIHLRFCSASSEPQSAVFRQVQDRI